MRAQEILRVCAAACLLLFASGSWALSPQAVFATASRSVAALEVLDDAGNTTGTYSATQVDGQNFVALCDVLDTHQAVRITLQAAVFNAKVTARDRERNLCLLEVDAPSSSAIVLQTQPPAIGSRVYAVSNALGLGVGISEGVISGIRHFANGDYLQFTAPISPGSEGGALVDEQGQLLGILDYRHRSGQNVNFAAVSAWVGAIKSRSVAAAAQLERFDTANALSQQKKWPELTTLAADWLRLQPDNPDALRFTAEAARARKDINTELKARTALFQSNPGQLTTGMDLGETLLSNGRIPQALEHARLLVASQPESGNAHWLLARALRTNGLTRDAQTSYQHAIALDPWQLGAYSGLAELAQENGDAATAIGIWSRLSGLYPGVLSLRLSLAQAYLAAGQAPLAYSTLEKLPAKDADSAIAWYWRGVTLSRLGSPLAAVQAYQNSLERKLESSDWAWAGIGAAMADMKRMPEAIRALESAVQANPAADAWRYQLAVRLKDGGRGAEALAITTALTQKSPNQAWNWRQHGFVLATLGKTREAIPALEKSLQMEPQQPKVWGALIETLTIAGDHRKARDAYQKLRTFDANAADAMYRAYILPYEGNTP